MQVFLIKGGKMKEKTHNCASCKYREELPFADEWTCMNENSDYADCECNPDDTCECWEER